MFSYKNVIKKLSKDYMVEEIKPGIIRVAGVSVTMEDFLSKTDPVKNLANTISFSLVKRESLATASKEHTYSINAIKRYVEEMK